MRRIGYITRLLSALSLFLTLGSAAAWSSPVMTDHVTARLIPETSSVRPGGTLWVMLHLKIKAGWHTYWRNPGDSGEPPHIAWTLPQGVEAGDIQWPYPRPLPYGPLLNYGYSGEALHLVPIRVGQSWPAGKPLDLHAKVSWLACSDICVPEGGDFDLSLPTRCIRPAARRRDRTAIPHRAPAAAGKGPLVRRPSPRNGQGRPDRRRIGFARGPESRRLRSSPTNGATSSPRRRRPSAPRRTVSR